MSPEGPGVPKIALLKIAVKKVEILIRYATFGGVLSGFALFENVP